MGGGVCAIRDVAVFRDRVDDLPENRVASMRRLYDGRRGRVVMERIIS
jgi:hypothetical protein